MGCRALQSSQWWLWQWGRLTTRDTTGDWVMRSTARVTTSSSLKCRDQERSTMFLQLHITQNGSIQILTRLGSSHVSGGALVHSTSLSALGHPHHIPSTHPHCPAFCWYVWTGGISGTRFPALGRVQDRGLFRARQVPLPPMSESGCLPGRGGLKVQGEQGQQVQRGFTGCLLGHLHHRDLPREQES